MSFEELQLIEPLMRAVHASGYTEPSPIQAQAIPHVLAGRDLMGHAQTGTGKTAAFAFPILQRIVLEKAALVPAPIAMSATNPDSRNGGNNSNYRPRLPITPLRALILAPTRELAVQIGESFETYGRYASTRVVTVFGGVNQNPQVDRLRRCADILVATPGRLLDLYNQGFVKLSHIEVFVLDEADRMLDMGFSRDVRRIMEIIPAERQTLMFSATMPHSIRSLADEILTDPVTVTVTPLASTVDTIQQMAYFVERGDKPALLAHLLADSAIKRVLVFTRTKHGADKVNEQLERVGVTAQAIHGNKSQSARQKALNYFKMGRTRVLIATDIASRGIDVDDITHVINYDLPDEAESYVHRIGRTGRAGAGGAALSFIAADERSMLVEIERLIKVSIPKSVDHPHMSSLGIPMPGQPRSRYNNGGGYNDRNRNGGGGYQGRNPRPQGNNQDNRAPRRGNPDVVR